MNIERMTDAEIRRRFASSQLVSDMRRNPERYHTRRRSLWYWAFPVLAAYAVAAIIFGLCWLAVELGA